MTLLITAALALRVGDGLPSTPPKILAVTPCAAFLKIYLFVRHIMICLN